MVVELFPKPATSKNANYQTLVGKPDPYKRRATPSSVFEQLDQRLLGQLGLGPPMMQAQTQPVQPLSPTPGYPTTSPGTSPILSPGPPPGEVPYGPGFTPPGIGAPGGPSNVLPAIFPSFAAGQPNVGPLADAARLFSGALGSNPFIDPTGRARLGKGYLPDLNMINPAFWRYTSPVQQQSLQGLYLAARVPLDEQNFYRSMWRPLGLD